jgi:tRNA dimethylallyltransferase
MKHLVVITGPTAVGKTALTLRLANHFHTPIVNADSRQMFRQIPVGTAAPTPEERAQAEHYFVGFLNLDQYYSASNFEDDALNTIEQIHRQNDVAIISGGSMMYIDAVCNGIDDIPTVNEQVREEVKKWYAERGLAPLLEYLKQKDPKHYEEVDRHNPRRVMHAVEICLQTGKPYSSFRTGEKKCRPFRIIKIGVNRPREELYQRINQRVDQMMEQGMMEEAKEYYTMRQLNSLNTVGYKELFNYMDGVWTLDTAVERIKSNTRRYARKQLTWFKRDPEMTWFHPEDYDAIVAHIEQRINAQ